MRSLIALLCLILLAGCDFGTRSNTIALEAEGLELTYSIAWYFGMEEKFALSRKGDIFSTAESHWIELYAKPYNSGLAVYRSNEGETYYFGTGYQLFIFDARTDRLKVSCSSKDVPAYTPLGKKLFETKDYFERRAIDPKARRLFSYVEVKEKGDVIPVSPPISRYYATLKYLGKFGLVRSGGRGNEIRFVPLASSPEPQMSLSPDCG